MKIVTALFAACMTSFSAFASADKIDFTTAVTAWTDNLRAARAAGLPFEPTTACYAGTIACGQTASGRVSIDSCESDNLYAVGYEFNGTAGQTITVSAVSFDFAMTIILMDGRQGAPATTIKRDDVFRTGETAQFTHTLTFSGPHIIFVTPGTRSTFGNYAVTVTCAATSDACNASQPLTVGGPAWSGTLSTTDCKYGDAYADYYSFTANEGVPVRITISPSFAPYAEAMAGDGARGVWDQLELTAPLTFTYWPEQSGPQRLLVSSHLPNVTGAYTVRLELDPTSPCKRRSVRH